MAQKLGTGLAAQMAVQKTAAIETVAVAEGVFAGLDFSYLALGHIFLQTRGAMRATLAVNFPGNAVVDDFRLKVTAMRADIAAAAVVAQLRGEAGAVAGEKVVIADFGTLRTVARLSFDQDCFITRVEAWNGTEFPAFGSFPFSDTRFTSSTRTGQSGVRFRSDVRTQKLRVTVLANANVDTLMAGMTLVLPDAPRDLTLRIDAGAPVWSLPGPAVKGTSPTLTTTDWNDKNERLVDLTAEMAARLGDPTDGTERSFELALDSAEAGVLALELHARAYRRIRRATIGGAAARELSHEDEGAETLVLGLPDLPAAARLQEIALSVKGAYGPERRQPPVGPDPAPLPGGAPGAVLAQLDLTPERAAILTVPAAPGVPELSGLRLNLTAGPDGAEIALVPWEADPVSLLPGTAMEAMTSAPLTLDAGAAGWVTLSFAKPVPVPEAAPLFAALLVRRGAVTASLSAAGATFRLGPAGGPWRALPRGMTTGGLAGLGLPCRSVGDAADPAAPAPVILSFGGTTLALDPGPRDRRLGFGPGAPGLAAPPALGLTRLGPGWLELTDIDVTTDI